MKKQSINNGELLREFPPFQIDDNLTGGYCLAYERVVVKIEKLAQTYHDVETRRTYLPQLLKALEEE